MDDVRRQAIADGLVMVTGAPRMGYCSYHGGGSKQAVWKVAGPRARGTRQAWICSACLSARHKEWLKGRRPDSPVNPEKEVG